MITEQLLDYIKQQLLQGVSKEDIGDILLAQGWQPADIEEAFKVINSSNSSNSLNNAPSQFFSLQNQSFQFSQSSAKQPIKGPNKLLFAIISIIGVLVIGGGVFGYFYYFQETPQKVFEKMKFNLINVKTFEYQGQIKAEIKTPALSSNINFIQPMPQNFNINQTSSAQVINSYLMNFNAKSDISDLNNPKGSFVFDIKTNVLNELKEPKEKEFSFGLEIRLMDNEVVYFKLNNFPKSQYFDLSFLSNQWIKVEAKDVKNQFGFKNFDNQFKEKEKQQELIPEQVQKIQQIVSQADILKTIEKLPNEKIEEVDTHHYKLFINKEKFNKLIVDISNIIKNESLTQQEITELNKELDRIEFSNVEIWIGKKDYLPYKIILSIKIKETAESKISGQIDADLLFKNYNQPIQINIPSQSENLEDVLKKMFQGFLNNAQLPQSQSSLQPPKIKQ
ncbi:MAG: hypothetical protein ACP5QN_02105 [Minisyncoccia bacterium]